MTRNAIFDCDGVLVDTEGFQLLGWRQVLKPLGISISKKEYLQYAGKHGRIIEKELAEKYGLNLEKERLLEKKQKLLIELFEEKPLEKMPFAEAALKLLEKNNFLLAVSSGSPEKELKMKLEKTGLKRFFPIILGGNSVKRGKPFPDIYIKTAEKMGVKPGDCVVFEDTQYGVESAKSAGAKCFAIPNQWSMKQDFSKADKKFKSLKEATKEIEKEL